MNTQIEKNVPVVETSKFLNEEGDYLEDCRKVVKAFEETGCLIIRDPRVNETHNNEFISMMENFFDSRGKRYYNNENLDKDVFPQYSYQVGATPEGKELARNHCPLMKTMTGENQPMSECPPPLDAKWRYFWHVGERQEESDQTIQPPVHKPEDFPEWEETMNRWGNLMLECCLTVAKMLALGLGFEKETFADKMKKGAHLLAPTGSDLTKYDVKTIFANFHYDFNFLTIHGKSRFPGLFIWLKDGTRISVSMPDGCLLLQAGKQLEYLTGGMIKAGFHEVIYTEKTKAALDKALEAGRIPWRISSTLFSHINQNVTLEPLGPLATKEAKEEYPPLLTKDQVIMELRAIGLAAE